MTVEPTLEMVQRFSCPQPDGADQLVALEAAVVSWHARRILEDAIQSLEKGKHVGIGGVETILRDWSTSQDCLWRPAIGLLWRSLSSNDEQNIAASVVRCAMLASESGVEGSWKFSLDRSVQIRVGSCFLPGVTQGQVSRTDGDLEGWVATKAGRRIRLRDLSESELASEAAASAVRAKFALLSRTIEILPANTRQTDLIPPGARSRYLNEADGEGWQVVGDALRLLEQCPNELAGWVAAVVRAVVPISNSEGDNASSSSPWDWGTVAITVDSNPVAVAEMLVHEASHQHFFVAKRLGRVDDGSDVKVYHSPMVDKERELERMLLAYHALGNMLLFHHIVMAKGLGDPEYGAQRVAELCAKLSEVRLALADNSALTTLGQAIFFPLDVRLGQLGICSGSRNR